MEIESRKLLKKNGKLIFEIGMNQEKIVKKLLEDSNFYINEHCKDIQSCPRVFVATKLF